MTKRAKTTAIEGAPAVEPIETPPLDAGRANIFGTAKTSLRDGMDVAKAAAKSAGAGASQAAAGARKLADAGASAASTYGAAAYQAVGDLNGDGKVDAEDWKIARAATGRVAAGVAREAGDFGKAVARHEITKDAAAGAAVGALIALPIPFVGPTVGAAAGAAVGLTRGVIDSGAIGDVVGQVVSAVINSSKQPNGKK